MQVDARAGQGDSVALARLEQAASLRVQDIFDRLMGEIAQRSEQAEAAARGAFELGNLFLCDTRLLARADVEQILFGPRTGPRAVLTTNELSGLLGLVAEPVVLGALDAIDRQRVTCAQLHGADRRIWLVASSEAAEDSTHASSAAPARSASYLVLGRHYCSCKGFLFNVLTARASLCCKHQLAVWLAQSGIGLVQRVELAEAEFVHLLAGPSAPAP